MTIAGDLLRETATAVDGPRNQTHGDKSLSFDVIAQGWQWYLDSRKNQDPLNGRDVAQMMVILKIARSIVGEPVKDHFADESGYAAIAWQCELAEQRLNGMLKEAMGPIKTPAPPEPESITVPEDIWPCGCYKRDGDSVACPDCIQPCDLLAKKG